MKKRIISLLLTVTMIMTSFVSVHAAEDSTSVKLLASFDFDTKASNDGSLDGGDAVAKGSYSLVSHDEGQALNLEGHQYLSVTAKDGSSLLTGLDEFTVSFYYKAESGSANWAFYAAPNGNAPVYLYEKYLGIFDNGGAVTAERFNNSGTRSSSLSYGVSGDRWNLLTVVYEKTKYTLYVNGTEVGTEASTVDISNLLGNNSVLYIGMAPWKSGEYYKGLIDDFKIYEGVLTAEDIAKEALNYVDKSALEDAIEDAAKIEKDDYTANTWQAFQAALDRAEALLEKEDALQNEINRMLEELKYYQNNLKKQADKSVLEEVVIAVEDYPFYDFTSESWGVVDKALTDAKEVLFDADANQSEVNVAVRDLDEAVGELVLLPEEERGSALPYVDVSKDDWFYESVLFIYEPKVMTGMDEKHFGPYLPLSRAQLALILYRIEEKPDVTTEKSFADIAGDEWYGEAVLWAAEAGIVNGYENGCFGPADNITREQMAVMMHRYTKYLEKDDASTGNLSVFLDVEAVSPFAVNAMSWANGNGIITGKENGTKLDPQGTAARCEAAAILERFVKKYGKDEETASDFIALMDYYMPNAKETLYSGVNVESLTVNVSGDGTLSIGTASVKDIIFARRYQMTCEVDVKEYEITDGINTIELDVEVPEGETLVILQDDTIEISYTGETTETAGAFAQYTTVDNEYQAGDVFETESLYLEAEIGFAEEEIRIFEDFEKDTASFHVASSAGVYPPAAPFAYWNKDLFENKVITKIGIPVKTVNAVDNNQVFTVTVVDKATFKNAIEVYPLTIPIEKLGNSTTVNKMIYVDCYIPVEKGQSLAFGAKSGDITWGYYGGMNNNKYAFYINAGTSSASQDTTGNAIIFDIYAEAESSYDTQISRLEEKEAQAKENMKMENLIAVVEDKNMSIIADSISTYQGYNNNAATSNSTTGGNAVFYSSANLASVNDTWWMQAIQKTNMNLLVNNAWSGSKVWDSHYSAGYQLRAENMHDDTGMNAGTEPDIITVFLGINDFDANAKLGTYSVTLYDKMITENADGTVSYKEPTNVTEAYIIMMDKMAKKYEDVDIFCFTLLPNSVNTNYTFLEQYNDMIRRIAADYDATVVDLYRDSGITSTNFHSYMIDGLHPNEVGMDLITDTLVRAMMERYIG